MFDSITFAGGVVLTGTVLGAGVGIVLARHAWSNRDVPGATVFSALSFAVAGWCIFSLLLLTSASLARARLWTTLIGICVTAIPVLWLTFALEYTGREDWVSAKTLPLIWAEPVCYTVFALVSPRHGFVSDSATLVANDGLTTLSVAHAPPFYFHLIYLFVVLVTGFGFLTGFLAQADRLYRKQTVAIILAGLLPLVGTALFSFVDLSVAFGLTPVFFAASAILEGLALFRYDFLNVAPLASEVVLSEMDDPVIVVADERIVEYNPAARPLFEGDTIVGSALESVIPGLLDAVANGRSFSPSVGAGNGSVAETPVYDPRSTPIRDHHGAHRGDIFVLREITERKRREETLRALQSATRRFMNAEQPEDIAEIAVRTAEEVLDHPYSTIVFPNDDESVLRSVAMTDLMRRGLDEELAFSRDAESVWSVFESGTPVVYDSVEQLSKPPFGFLPFGCLLLLPLGEHGVLGVGSDTRKRTFTENERRFARILASTTETALDRARRERELRESQAMVEERTEQIEFFNGVLRHDILNGITVINGNLALLEPHVEASGATYFETVRNWSEDIGQLTEKVRSVSQTVTNESVSLDTVSLSRVLTKRVRKVKNTYPNVTVETDIEGGLSVPGNELLGEVVENVLLNAVEHHDRESPSVAVRARRSDEVVRVEIEDDGPGIPEEMKTQVFDRNVTSETTGSIGFGLYFVSVMMDQYGGAVWFEDADPRGTAAVLTFPPSDTERIGRVNDSPSPNNIPK